MEAKEIKEKISDGWIHARIIIEILGKPKEHVESTLKQYVTKLKETEKNIAVIKEEFSEAEPQGEKQELFSIFVELELIAKDPATLAWLCFDYMPSSVEILEPEYLKYKRNDFSGFINDLLARLHDIDMRYKNASVENTLISKSVETMLRRLIKAALKNGSKSLEELSDEAGIGLKELFIFLESMVDDKIIKREAGKYALQD
ncbi:MAG: hypothetical protein Q8O89_07690 [Nanoarchaeota archaeon]|nr:hypothetical protein [Nanoarchaeota archaeon]